MTIDQRVQAEAAPSTDPRVERVVLAAGGGAAAMAATRWIAERSLTRAMHVEVLTVLPESLPGSGIADPRHVAMGRRMVEQATEYLEMVASSVELTSRVAAGAREAMLIDAAEHADLLVLGSNRIGPIALRRPTAFTTRLAEAVRCPVVLVPVGWQRSPGHVVVGVEGDGSSDAAVDVAAHEAAILRRRLVLLHGLLPPGARGDGSTEPVDARASADACAADLRAAVSRARRIDSGTISEQIEDGDVVRALLHAATTAGLLVVGTHDPDRLDRVLAGSVGRSVLSRALCPVVLVHPDAPARPSTQRVVTKHERPRPEDRLY